MTCRTLIVVFNLERKRKTYVRTSNDDDDDDCDNRQGEKKRENVVNAVVSLYTDGVEQRRRCIEREQTTCVCV